MQEQADISRVRHGNATPMTKPEQTQIPSDNHNPDSIEGKPACDNSDSTDDTNHSSIRDRDNHPGKPSNFSTSNDCQFVYDPGRSILNSKDGSTRDVGDSTSSSSDSASCTTATDTLHGCDRDRSDVMVSNIYSVSPSTSRKPFLSATSFRHIRQTTLPPFFVTRHTSTRHSTPFPLNI